MEGWENPASAVGRDLKTREFEGKGMGGWGSRKLLAELIKGHGHSRFAVIGITNNKINFNFTNNNNQMTKNHTFIGTKKPKMS